MNNSHEFYMKKALIEAERGATEDEVPVGAIVVHENIVIAKSYNLCIKLCDPTAHAEIQVITAACNYLQSRYLNECILYTTLEPCNMCSGAMYWAKLGHLVYGAEDRKKGFSQFKNNLIHPKTKITKGILQYESSLLLSDFFKKKRNLKEN
ncbi:MAG: nucleoside deaminase [Flavobacteriales bacterium TMED191]|nr:MAG: nucleoside deaminase [Flavobacteriales bacterium TMED191]